MKLPNALHRALFASAPPDRAVRVVLDLSHTSEGQRTAKYPLDRNDLYTLVEDWLENLEHNLRELANLGDRFPGVRVLFNPNVLDAGQPYASAVPDLLALVSDVDEKKAQAFRVLPERLAALATVGIRPFATINSGGGRHLYFLLRRPECAWWDEQGRPSRARHANVRLQRFLGSDAVHSPAHLFGLPGTINPKYPDGRRVEVLSLDESARYTSDELHGALDSLGVGSDVPESLMPPRILAPPRPPRARPAGRKTKKSRAQQSLSFDVSAVDEDLRALILSDEAGSCSSPSEKELFIAASLLRTGHAAAEVQTLIAELALRRGKPGPLGYSSRTVAKAALPSDEWATVTVDIAGGEVGPRNSPFVRFLTESGEGLYWRGGQNIQRNQREILSLAIAAKLESGKSMTHVEFAKEACERSLLVEIRTVSRPRFFQSLDEAMSSSEAPRMTKPKRIVAWGVPTSLQHLVVEDTSEDES